MAAPTFQAAGTQQSSATASVNVSWPTHQTGDVALFIVETSGGGGTILAPSGWSSFTGTPVVDVADATGSKLHIWWRRATSNSEAAAPTGFNATSDHVLGKIYTFRGCAKVGNPWDVRTTGTKTTASTTATVPAVTTTIDDTLIAMVVGRPNDSASTTHFSNPTNSNLTDLAEAAEAGTTLNNGGGFVVVYGTKESAGDTGTTSITKSVSTTDTYFVIAFKAPKAYALPVDNGAFTLTGNDAVLNQNLKIDGGTGAFTLTGNDATLTKTGGLNNYTMPVDAGNFALTGGAPSLTRTYGLAADTGAIVLTGNPAGLADTDQLQPDAGTFALTGGAPTLLRTYYLSGGAGTFTLTGNNATFTIDKLIAVDQGIFALIGNAATFAHDIKLFSDVATFNLTGNPASFLIGYVLNAESGQFSETGNNVTFSGSRIAQAGTGTFALTGNSVSLYRSYPILGSRGTFVLTGLDAILVSGRRRNVLIF